MLGEKIELGLVSLVRTNNKPSVFSNCNRVSSSLNLAFFLMADFIATIVGSISSDDVRQRTM